MTKFQFEVLVSWKMEGYRTFEAETLEEAEHMALRMTDPGSKDFDSFLEGSVEVCTGNKYTEENAGPIECSKIAATPHRELALMIGTTETEEGAAYLEERIRNGEES